MTLIHRKPGSLGQFQSRKMSTARGALQWKGQYAALYDRTFRVLFDAGINDELAIELATHRTLAAALTSCERTFRFSALGDAALDERKRTR